MRASAGLKDLGFDPCYHDRSVFANPDRSILIGLYVDDRSFLGEDPLEVEKVIQGISSKWKIKDIGNVSQILGLQVTWDKQNRTLRISQKPYIQALVQELGMQEARAINERVTVRNTLFEAKPDEHLTDQHRYQKLIDHINWLASPTRLDIQYLAGRLSQHSATPTVRHWNASLQAIRYLIGTEDYSITYRAGKGMETKLQGYCNADYAGDINDRRSISGHIFFLGGGPVTWSSTKQRCVSTSTAEAEYITLTDAAKQAVWIRRFLRELNLTEYLPPSLAVPIFSDNQACILVAGDPVVHRRTKHFDIRYHYIRELVSTGKVSVDYINTTDMIADILTKPIPLAAFQRSI